MDLRLEVVVLPVTDVDKAKQFYEMGLACRLDADVSPTGGYRIVQVTPPGPPGTEGRAPGPDPQGLSYATFASFSDPDDNSWLLQEIIERLPGRV
jgi:catechol 2,3-dioxygenase-like lactoylglutathione lyase family enzyme